MTTLASPSILITGATGTIGSSLAKQLSEKGISFRVMVRSMDSAGSLASLRGAEIVIGDFNDPSGISKALEGIEKSFLLTNSSAQAEAQQLNFVMQAKKAGIRHIVKLSQLAADLHSPVRFLRYHAAVEQAIKESGMDYTFLRPNLFMQGLLAFRDPIIKKGMFFASVGNAKISLVDIRDIAAVAAVALTELGHSSKVYDITGPASLTHDEIAAILSSELGKQVKFADVAPEEMRQAILAAGFPEWQADGLIEDYAHYARGEASIISSAVKDTTGKDARNFNNFVKDHASLFQ
jgi:uncharacterized protein YbjT (DUF2867 family)